MTAEELNAVVLDSLPKVEYPKETMRKFQDQYGNDLIASADRGALAERARIVAYLKRKMIEAREAVEMREKAGRKQDVSLWLGQEAAYTVAAEQIEAGDHLK